MSDEQAQAPSSREVTEYHCDEILLQASQMRLKGEQTREMAANSTTEMFGHARTAEAAQSTFTSLADALEAMAKNMERGVQAAWTAQNAEDARNGREQAGHD